MKRHLLASTMILAASLGAASAEVTLSGSARMGVIDDFGADNTGFTSRARVEFTLSGETDGGLSFGASFRADNAVGANAGTAGTVFMSGAFGKLSMGDVDGAANAAVGHVDGVGLTGLGDLNENIFLANGGLSGYIGDNYTGDPTLVLTGDPSALYEYSIGDVTLYGSFTNPSYRFVDSGDAVDGDAYAIGAAYVMGSYKFSAAYESASLDDVGSDFGVDYDQLIVGADGTFGAVTVKARYGTGETGNSFGAFSDLEQWGLSATYTSGPLALTAFVTNKSDTFADTGVTRYERDAYGIGASYDLGGGAKVVGGYVNRDDSGTSSVGTPTEGSQDAFDLGVSFTF